MNSASTQDSLELPQTSAQAPSGGSFNLDIGRNIRMHRKVAIGVAVAVALGIFSYGISRKPYFQTEALIYVQPMKAKALTDTTDGNYDASRYDTYLQQQLQTIVRADVLRDALSTPAARAWRFPGEPESLAILRLHNMIKVERVEQSYELSVQLSGGNPIVITDMLNAVTNAYIHAERADELSQSNQQLKILEQELERILMDLQNDRRQQSQLSISLGVADTSGEAGNPYDSQLNDLRSEIGKAVAAHDLASAQAASVDGTLGGASLRAASDEAANIDPGLSALRQTIGSRRSVLTSEMSGLKPLNPQYQKDQDELTHLDASLAAMETEARNRAAIQIQQKLNLEARRTADVEQRLKDLLAQKTAIATGATPTLQHAADLTADIARLQARYSAVSNAINSIELEKDTSGLVHVLVPAAPPPGAKTSAKNLMIVAAIPCGLIAGILAAIILSKLDPKIYIAQDVSQALGFFPMATLPDNKEVDRHSKDEFILRLLAGIDQIHRTDGAKMFVFTATSAVSNVTDLVASLARKMERLGYRVATITATELIESQEVASGFFKAGAAEHLPVVTHENFVVQKIADIKKNADYLFIEAYPILSSSEAEFAARLSDVIILVAESGETTRSELASSFALIKRLRVPGAAIVLTELSTAQADKEFISSVNALKLRRAQA